MIVGFFKANQPLSVVFILILASALWAGPLIHVADYSWPHSMPLFDALYKNIKTQDSRIPYVIAILLICGGGLLLNFVVNENDVTTKRTAIPGLMYMTILSCSPNLTTLHPVLLANLFLILAYHRIINLYRASNAFAVIFDFSLLVSLASLCYFPVVALFPVIWIGLFLYHPFIWREWVIGLFGILTPYFFVFTWFFWYDRLDFFWYDKIIFPISHSNENTPIAKPTYYLIGTLFFTITFALVKTFDLFNSSTVKSRKALVFMLWFMLFAFLSAFISPSWTFRDFALLSIPLAVFISHYFVNITRDWMAEAIYLFLILSIIYVRLAT